MAGNPAAGKRDGETGVGYCVMKVQGALTKLKRKIPYGWDLNIYRGCEHACQYCYAMDSHRYLASGDFAGDIFVKTNIAEALEKELRSPDWRREVINIGGVTDSYQPAEAEYQLMPEILRLMIKYQNPAIISTKSSLILRDYDLIAELSGLTYVNVAVTITTADESLRTLLEPGAAAIGERGRVLREFARTNASTGLHMMPVIPRLTDSRDNCTTLLALAKESGVDYFLPGTLYLRGRARQHFLAFLDKEFPHLTADYALLYRRGGADKEYKDAFYQMFNPLRAAYGLTGSYTKPMRERLPPNLFIRG